MATIEANAETSPFREDVEATQAYIDSPRFAGITRLYSARQVAEQRGTIPSDYPVAREAATDFFLYLRDLFAQKLSITEGSTWADGPPRPRDPSARIRGRTWPATR